MSAVRTAVRALFSPVFAVGRAYNETAKRAPMATGVVTTIVKTGAADYFAQKVIERREEVDWRRNALFSFFGFAYLGCFQYWLYNNLFTRITPSVIARVGQRGVGPALTFLDQCIHHPFVYFPCFYALKGLVEGRPLTSSMQVYRDDMWENCKALWAVWVPAQLINFSVVPLHLRIPFVAAVSFGWTVIISVMRGKLTQTFEDPAAVPIMLQQQHAHEEQEEQLAAGLLADSMGPAMPAAAASMVAVSHAESSSVAPLLLRPALASLTANAGSLPSASTSTGAAAGAA